MNLKLTLAYEGTPFFGWQKNPLGPTVEASLQAALEQILRHPVSLQAASRTDRGVHAKGQIVNFYTDSAILLHKLRHGLNGILPKEISVLSIEEMPASFHPTLDAKGKIYCYDVCLGISQLPFYYRFSWHFPYPLSLEAMEIAASHLTGEHDFAAFTNERQEETRRTVSSIHFIPSDSRLKIQVKGNNFLYKMVRNIVGTLLYVGCGKLQAEEIPSILQSKDRRRAGVTAPAHGLCLNRVLYDPS